MKNLNYILLLFAILFAISKSANASPAYPCPIEFNQPDGSILTIMLKGDEYIKWAETKDGYSIIFNKSGFYEYATLDKENQMVCSGIVAKNSNERSKSDIEFLNKTEKLLQFNDNQLKAAKSLRQVINTESQRAFPTTGNRKLICILMGFSDLGFTKTKTDFNNLFNQINYTTDSATGSVKDFYKESSYNKFNLTVTVAGSYLADHNMAYYGANDASGNDYDPKALITEAVQKADPDVNYADFDNDNDGSVDGVYVIFAGYGEEAGASANAIWSHAWNIPAITLDGKTISKYSCSPELRSTSGTGITRIGVICHEFGHVLGSPDFYDVNYATGGSFLGTGKWDLMANGSWNNNGITPANHNGYTKTLIYHWADYTILDSPGMVTLQNSTENETSFFRINTSTENEFFICENRQNIGFDSYLPGHGLIIYHVHKDIPYYGINATYPQMMYPVCASASSNPSTTPSSYGSINSGGCPFPGTSSKTSFTDFTTPYEKSWIQGNTNKPITNITENTTNKTISFEFIYGASGNPKSFNAIPAGSSQINLNWTKNANNNNVLIAFSTSNSIGTPVNGTNYTAGNAIPGGGTVLYNGNSLFFNHTSLTENTIYYYKAWSVKTDIIYSGGYNADAKTSCSSLSLPFSENFNDYLLPTCWTTSNIGPGIFERWSTSSTSNAGGSAYEMKCHYKDVDSGTTRLISPPLNTLGLGQLNLSFKHMFDDYMVGLTLKIQSSTDGINWTDEAWSLPSSKNEDVGPATINTTIDNNLNSSATYIAFVVAGDLFSFDDWYIDNVNINGSSICTPPATQAKNFVASENNPNSIRINWTRGTGDKVLIIAREGNPVDISPSNGTSYAANASFNTGDQIGTNNYAVYNGTGTNVLVTNLLAGRNYYFSIIEYSNTDKCYKLPALLGATATKLLTPILVSPSNESNYQPTSPNLIWDASGVNCTYNLQVSLNSSFTDLIINESEIIDTIYQVTSVLNNNTKYYWRVSATNLSGTTNWSTVFEFNVFEFFTEQTQISLIGVEVYPGSLAWGDFDSDGDLDILLTGYTGVTRYSKIYRNNGNNTFTEQTDISLTGINASSVNWGDYDNDGDLDILMAGYTGSTRVSKIYKNNGNNTFSEQTGISLTGVTTCAAAWGDYDNDGDLDILLTGLDNSFNRISKIYRNNGDNTFTEQTGISLTEVNMSSVAWGDYNNDGYLDILLSGFTGSSRYSKIYKNNKDNSFTEQTGISLTGVNSGASIWGDYDNDGDLDILITGYTGSTRIAEIYKNNGNNTFSIQTDIQLSGVTVSSAAWGDFDNDGDLDILLAGFDNDMKDITKLYQNNGDNSFSELGSGLTGFSNSSVVWGDYDNDGDLDILMAGNDGTTKLSKVYQNNLLISNVPPSAPVNIQASAVADLVSFTWDKASDDNTSEDGMNYNLYVYEEGQTNYIMAPHAFKQIDVLNGRRLIAQLGKIQWRSEGYNLKLAVDKTYYWSVQAIDNTLAGGEWAAERTFSTTNGILTAPELLSPDNGIKNPLLTPTLSWSAVGSATSYTIQVSETSTFITTIVNQSELTGTNYTASGLSKNNKYYWRVNATNEGGNSSWSEIWDFTIQDETGIENINGTSYTIYPNPTSGLITIKCSGNIESQIDVYSLDGMLLQQVKTYENNTILDLKEIQAGIYFIKISNAEGVIIRKVTKN